MPMGVATRGEGIQVIARAAELLRALGSNPSGLTIRELTARSGLPRSTTQRLIQTLRAEGFVSASLGGRVRIGPALMGIAIAGRPDLSRDLGPYAERLALSLRETVDVAVLDEGQALSVEQVPSSLTLRVVSGVGARLPLHCTASGKVLLAASPAAEVDDLVPHRLRRFTSRTIVDRARLIDEIEQVRMTGLAFDREEHTLGICAVATSVSDLSGRSASIAVAMPSARFVTGVETAASMLLGIRAEAQAELTG